MWWFGSNPTQTRPAPDPVYPDVMEFLGRLEGRRGGFVPEQDLARQNRIVHHGGVQEDYLQKGTRLWKTPPSCWA